VGAEEVLVPIRPAAGDLNPQARFGAVTEKLLESRLPLMRRSPRLEQSARGFVFQTRSLGLASQSAKIWPYSISSQQSWMVRADERAASGPGEGFQSSGIDPSRPGNSDCEGPVESSEFGEKSMELRRCSIYDTSLFNPCLQCFDRDNWFSPSSSIIGSFRG
jgi:hypothetical protein